VGFVVDEVAPGQVFSEYFGFPCQIIIQPTAPHSSSPGIGTIGRLVAGVQSGLGHTQPQEKNNNNNNK
jgi:hypothetical protein